MPFAGHLFVALAGLTTLAGLFIGAFRYRSGWPSGSAATGGCGVCGTVSGNRDAKALPGRGENPPSDVAGCAGAVCVAPLELDGLKEPELVARLVEVAGARAAIDGLLAQVAGRLVETNGRVATAWIMREYTRVSGFQARCESRWRAISSSTVWGTRWRRCRRGRSPLATRG